MGRNPVGSNNDLFKEHMQTVRYFCDLLVICIYTHFIYMYIYTWVVPSSFIPVILQRLLKDLMMGLCGEMHNHSIIQMSVISPPHSKSCLH